MKAIAIALLVAALLAASAALSTSFANVASARVTWNCVVTQESPYHLELCSPVGQVWERIPATEMIDACNPAPLPGWDCTLH